MEDDDDDDNDASDRASFFSPMRGGGRSQSVGRSTFPCFSYFMIPKREWEHIDYNDGHQATTIEQKTCLPMYVRTYAHAALHCLRMVFQS